MIGLADVFCFFGADAGNLRQTFRRLSQYLQRIPAKMFYDTGRHRFAYPLDSSAGQETFHSLRRPRLNRPVACQRKLAAEPRVLCPAAGSLHRFPHKRGRSPVDRRYHTQGSAPDPKDAKLFIIALEYYRFHSSFNYIHAIPLH